MRAGSFGGVQFADSTVLEPSSRRVLPNLNDGQKYLAVGMARSYGDVGLVDAGVAIKTAGLNKFLGFDQNSGVLECEPGVLLREIQAHFVKLGWMLAVTPGTSWVSVGGAIANDVHGKDHHFAGTFGDHVLSFELLRSDGSVTECSATINPELFRATIGGLGLTGMIVSAKIRLKKVAGPYFDSEVIPYSNLGEFFDISAETESQGWQATVSWFDCSTRNAGRGYFTRGNPSKRVYDAGTDDKMLNLDSSGLAVPFTPPFSLINKLTLDVFNVGYYNLQKVMAGKSQMHYKDFYYPLDGVRNWNRIYGPRGFFQYQSVVPMQYGREATQEMLDVIRKSGQGSFLGVLKTFADKKPAGLLSFAQHGVTLALDFVNRGAATETLFKKLDAIVSEAGGRLNPSKDARMSREMFQSGFPMLPEFLKYRDAAFDSDFARRVID